MKSTFLGRAVLLAIATASGELALLSSNANAAQLVVKNSSFEDDVLSEGGFTSNTLSAWQLVNEIGYGSGVYSPLDTPPYYFGESVPDGVNIAYSNGATLFQSLEGTLDASTLYNLSVSVGARPEPSVRFPGYGIQLWAGDLETGSLLAEVLSNDTTLVAPGTFQTVSLDYLSSNDSTLLGKNLGILLFPLNARDFPGVSQVNFDSVSLGATLIEPSPSPTPDLPVDPPSPAPDLPIGQVPVDPGLLPTPTPPSPPVDPETPPPISSELLVDPEPSPLGSEVPIEDTSLIPPVEPSIPPLEAIPVEIGALPTQDPITTPIESPAPGLPSPDALPAVAIAPVDNEQPSNADPKFLSGNDRPSPKLVLPPPAPGAVESSLESEQTRSSASVPEPSVLVGLAVALGLGWRSKRSG